MPAIYNTNTKLNFIEQDNLKYIYINIMTTTCMCWKVKTNTCRYVWYSYHIRWNINSVNKVSYFRRVSSTRESNNGITISMRMLNFYVIFRIQNGKTIVLLIRWYIIKSAYIIDYLFSFVCRNSSISMQIHMSYPFRR